MSRSTYHKIVSSVLLVMIPACGDGPLPTGGTAGLIVEGLEVIVKEVANGPTVSFGLYLKGGANYAGDDRVGIETLLLETAIRGTETRSRQTLRNRLTNLEATFEITQSFDYTGLIATTPRENFDAVWELFSDVLMRPRLEVGEINAVKKQSLARFNQRSMDPMDHSFNLALATYYQRHPYRYGPRGNDETLIELERRDLVEFYRDDFTKNRALLIVVGSMSVKEVTLLARQLARRLPQGPELLAPAFTFDAGRTDVALRRESLPTHFITGIFSAPRLGHADYPTYRVALELLRQRTVAQLQSRRGLTDHVTVSEGKALSNYGSFSFTTGDPEDAVPLVSALVADLKTGELNDAEIAGAAKQVLINHLLEDGDVLRQLKQMAEWSIIGEDWRQLQQFPLELTKINSEAVRLVIRKYMHSIHWGAVGPSRRMTSRLFRAN